MFFNFGKKTDSANLKNTLKTISPAISMLKYCKACASILGDNVISEIIIYPDGNDFPYYKDYLYVGVKFDNVSPDSIFDKIFLATVALVKSAGFTSDACSMLTSFAKATFGSTIKGTADAFSQLVDTQTKSDDYSTVFQVLLHYRRISESQIGFFGFKIPIPNDLYDIENDNGQNGISKEKTNEYIQTILKM